MCNFQGKEDLTWSCDFACQRPFAVSTLPLPCVQFFDSNCWQYNNVYACMPHDNGNLFEPLDSWIDTIETDEHKIAQRLKQISLGCASKGYLNYSFQVPKNQRLQDDPVTPRADQKCGKRNWDKQLKDWRRMLHVWDPECSEDDDCQMHSSSNDSSFDSSDECSLSSSVGPESCTPSKLQLLFGMTADLPLQNISSPESKITDGKVRNKKKFSSWASECSESSNFSNLSDLSL